MATEIRMDENGESILKGKEIVEQREMDCLMEAAYMDTKTVKMRREKGGYQSLGEGSKGDQK